MGPAATTTLLPLPLPVTTVPPLLALELVPLPLPELALSQLDPTDLEPLDPELLDLPVSGPPESEPLEPVPPPEALKATLARPRRTLSEEVSDVASFRCWP